MFTVIVQFETTADNQQRALEEIGDYVEEFLSRQEGFLRSRLHRALDGTGLVHYALWRSEDDFRAAGVKAREHPALPGLMQYKPRGQYYDVSREFSPGPDGNSAV